MNDKDTIAKAINIAMAIETGTIDYDFVLQTIYENPSESELLILFWLTFNEMTINAVKELETYKTRIFLENCLAKS